MCGTSKAHWTGEAEAYVSCGADSDSAVGESAASSGLLGSGKLISSNTSGGSDMLSLGYARHYGEDSADVDDVCSIVPWCEYTGPAP